jgi:hypothetical protein
MQTHRPDVAQVWEAIETYLAIAYAGAPPTAVRKRLDLMRAAGHDPLVTCSAIEHDPKDAPADADGPQRYSLRLGNRIYPHMKLVVDCRQSSAGCIFRADTHDAHCRPPAGSREAAMYQQLVDANREIATAIEHAWEAKGIPTFKTFLKQDLARRASSKT